MPKITRSVVRALPVAEGGNALSRLVDQLCGEVERSGNEVVSVSHATHNEGFRNDRIWTVLVTYRKAGSDG